MNTHSPISCSTTAGSGSASVEKMPAIQIWLVDDNEQIRSLVADGLKDFEGIQCARDFDSPNAVLSALASKPGPDLILLDIQMGDQNGLDAVRPIRSLSRATRVPACYSRRCATSRSRCRRTADCPSRIASD